jgi:hypothetical protein
MAERVTDSCTLTLLGISAMASERYAPAGLLIERHVVHTSRATYGYRIQRGNSIAAGRRISGVPQVGR